MTYTPTGAHPAEPRDQAQGMARIRARHRAAFGIDPPPDPPPVRAAMPPSLVTLGVRPVRVEHLDGCHGDQARVETLGWSDGRRTARCHDCLATRTVWSS